MHTPGQAGDDGWGDAQGAVLPEVPHVGGPDRRLLCAILVDAIVRFRRLLPAAHAAARRELVEIERWIRSNDRTWPCSFMNVCETLDLAHEPLRRAILGWRERDTENERVVRRRLRVHPSARRRQRLRTPSA